MGSGIGQELAIACCLKFLKKESDIQRLIQKCHQVFSELRAYLSLINEGYSLKDKLVIVVYLCSFPLRILCRIADREYKRTFIRPVIIKNRFGIYFCDKSFNSSRIVSELYEKELEKYFNIAEGIFVDVGAHIGKYSIRIARQLGPKGKVIAIEPEPYNFSILEKNVKLNGLKNVYLQNIACSSADGQSFFYIDSKATTLHSIYKNKYISGDRKIITKTHSLDSLISKLKFEKVDLIKIDVEGAELSVLKGAKDLLQSCRPKIIFEAWSDGHLREIKALLIHHNYRIKKILGENYLAY